jgi:hypothetical protein
MENRDRSYRGDIAEKLNIFDLVPKVIYNKRNADKSWKYKKYPDIDPNFICVSKDGTIGNIYKVGELIIAVPSQEGKEILNIDTPSNEAKWKRTPIPEGFLKLEENYRKDIGESANHKKRDVRQKYKTDRKNLISKHIKFIDNEFDKRKHGLFIKIDEEILYLTGSAYMFLNYYYLTDSDMYPLFRTTSLYTWLHWEAVKADKDVFGELRFKSRRVAWTSEAASEALNTVTILKYANIPVVSERKELAEELFQSKIIDSFKYYPTYFKPIISDPNTLEKKKLELTHNTAQKETARIKLYPTKVTAYDSTRVKSFAINDEVFKLEDVDFTAFRSRHKRCYNKSKNLHPKGKFGSTVGDKNINTETARYEWENANPLKRDLTGNTNTGLIALFVDNCYTDAENGMFDGWGYPIINNPQKPILNEIGDIVEFGSITLWKMEEDKMKKMKKSDLNSFYRNSPRLIEHALRNEGGINNDFDADNLNNHVDHLNSIHELDWTDIIYRGNLAWTGEPYKSDVEWKPNTKGKIFTTWLPPKELQNKSSIREFHGKQLKMPDNNHIACLGVDSYDLVGKAASGKGSDGAFTGYSKMSMTGCPSHSFFLKYKDRPDKRDDFYDDVIMTCQYFGIFALIESNKGRILEYMYDKGFTGYAMRRQDKKWRDLSDAERLYGGMPTSKEVIADQASLLKDYIMDNVGQNLDNECKVYFKDLITEWIAFKVDKRTEFDLAVASGFAIMGSQYKVKMRKVPPINPEGGLTLSSFGA